MRLTKRPDPTLIKTTWFAWYPVRVQSGEFVWLETVWLCRTTDLMVPSLWTYKRIES